MKSIQFEFKKCLALLIFAILASCSPNQAFTPEVLLPTLTKAKTLPPPTITNTPVNTSIPTPETPEYTSTPSKTPKPTKIPTGGTLGASISGYTLAPNGEGLKGVNIYYALSAYPGGTLLAVTDVNGYYSGIIAIPHTETVRVWAEFEGYRFKPGKADRAWGNNEFVWIHYGGYEIVELGFVGQK